MWGRSADDCSDSSSCILEVVCGLISIMCGILLYWSVLVLNSVVISYEGVGVWLLSNITGCSN